MPRFQVTQDDVGTPVVIVECPVCHHRGEFMLSRVELGSDVSCRPCGRPILVGPDDWTWITARAEIQRMTVRDFPADTRAR